jgi:hypothetical protein
MVKAATHWNSPVRFSIGNAFQIEGAALMKFAQRDKNALRESDKTATEINEKPYLA